MATHNTRDKTYPTLVYYDWEADLATVISPKTNCMLELSQVAVHILRETQQGNDVLNKCRFAIQQRQAMAFYDIVKGQRVKTQWAKVPLTAMEIQILYAARNRRKAATLYAELKRLEEARAQANNS